MEETTEKKEKEGKVLKRIRFRYFYPEFIFSGHDTDKRPYDVLYSCGCENTLHVTDENFSGFFHQSIMNGEGYIKAVCSCCNQELKYEKPDISDEMLKRIQNQKTTIYDSNALTFPDSIWAYDDDNVEIAKYGRELSWHEKGQYD